jgi:NAD(P)-dependent dehydrogenase (short-subunit alcohol dehydrogenase family)
VTTRAVLVTGASRGIGRAVAEAFAALGDRVAMHYNATPIGYELPGDGHVTVRGDVQDPDAVQSFVDAAAEALGGLDVVVNNAAIFPAHPVLETSYVDWQAAWRETLAVNLVGPANVCWCAARHMKRGSRIVNVSSRGAFRGEKSQPAYGASKAGLNSLTQSLALALGPIGVAVSAVAPGFVETDMANAALKSPRGPAIRAQSPFNRVARADEVAAAVVYLASPEAEWASGAILDLNGASYLR